MEPVFGGVAQVALTLHAGAMVLFAARVGLGVAGALPPDIAGRSLREIVPVYYLFVFGTAATAAVGLFPISPVDAVLIALSAGATLWLRQAVLPRINAASDARSAGGDGAAGAFSPLHVLSVVLNLAQMLLGLVLLLRLAP